MEVDDEVVQENNMENIKSINYREPSSTNTSRKLPHKDIIFGSFHLVPNVDIEVVYEVVLEDDEVVREVESSTRGRGCYEMPARLPHGAIGF